MGAKLAILNSIIPGANVAPGAPMSSILLSNGEAASSIFSTILSALYNVIFTWVYIICRGIFLIIDLIFFFMDAYSSLSVFDAYIPIVSITSNSE